MFSAMASDPALEETPLPPSLQTFLLPSSSSSSSSARSVPVASSDALPSSSVTTFNFEDHDSPTEDEEMTGRGGGTNHSSRDRTVNNEAATSTRDDSKRGSDSHSLSQSYLCHEQEGDRKETRNDRIEEN